MALAVFAAVTVGALTTLGATAAGGLQDASPTALLTNRRAKDLTVAGVYLQALQDYLTSLDAAAWDVLLAGWPPGTAEQTYCLRTDAAGCEGSDRPLPPLLADAPMPESHPYQLDRATARMHIRPWFWDCAGRRYAPDPTPRTDDRLIHVRATVLWRFGDEVRTFAADEPGVDRLLSPPSPAASLPKEVCP